MVYPRTHAHTHTRARVRGPAPANTGAPTRIHTYACAAFTREHTHNRAHTCERSRPRMRTSSICHTMLVISKILSPVLFPDRIPRHANYPIRLSSPTTLKPAQDANALHFLQPKVISSDQFIQLAPRCVPNAQSCQRVTSFSNGAIVQTFNRDFSLTRVLR